MINKSIQLRNQILACFVVMVFILPISISQACTVPFSSEDIHGSYTVRSSKIYSGSLFYDKNKTPPLGTTIILSKESYQVADKKYENIEYKFNCYEFSREGEIIPKFLTLHWGVDGGTNPVFTMGLYSKGDLVAELEIINKNEIWLLEYGWIFSLIRNN